MNKNVSKLFESLKGLGGYLEEDEGIYYLIDSYIPNIIELMQSNNFNLETIKCDMWEVISTEREYRWDGDYTRLTDEQYNLMKNTSHDIVLLFSNNSIEGNRQILIITLTIGGERYDVDITGIFYIDNTETIPLFTKDGWMDENTTTPTTGQSNNTNNNEDLENRVNNIQDKLDTLIKMLAK